MEKRIGIWGRVGTKLYVALGLAVFLTLLSSGVGVYYFERSGDLNHRLSRESVPVLSASLNAVADGVRLAEWSRGVAAAADAPGLGGIDRRHGAELAERIRLGLSSPAGVPELTEPAHAVHDAAVDVLHSAESVVSLSAQWEVLTERSSGLEDSALGWGEWPVVTTLAVAALRAGSISEVDEAWGSFVDFTTRNPGVPAEVVSMMNGGDGVFATAYSVLAFREGLAAERAVVLEKVVTLDRAVAGLAEAAEAVAEEQVSASLGSFDEGRLLLAGICLVSVLVATLTSWLWVGNNVLRRLSRLSARMRAMAGGELEEPVPEVGGDEIGQLAGSLEVFRRQALEVQRLNLVERLYGQLREAHEQLQAMQERLVAQEKLAALGEIVSGVAHEISNPLSFVKNFSEGSRELSEELFEILDGYREQLAEDDRAVLDDIQGELSDSLERVGLNGTRALTIVRRMQSLGVVGGEPQLTDVHSVLRRAVQLGCDTFSAEWGDFTVEPEYRFSERVGDAAMVASDFNEAVVNLVSNACYAMRLRREADGLSGYAPALMVGTELLDGAVAVTVGDNGTGIDDDVLPRIFDPFFTTRDGALGAGLGLPLAADVARRGGGDLTVRTEVGSGSVFTMTLPVDLPPVAADVVAERLGDDADRVARSFVGSAV